jgi:methylenetetrahydrofolate reductase (NADPH)
VLEDLEPLKQDEEKVRQFGIDFGAEQSHGLIEMGYRFLHYYTMNLETAVVKIITKLGILNQKRNLPFVSSTA